jgi:nucleotide sugar dehydrogenase
MSKTIGIFGLGIVGTAVYNGFLFNGSIDKIYRYDINNKYDKIGETVLNSDIIFICVPTPTIVKRNRYRQDLSFLDKAIDLINLITKEEKDIVIKSTVLPGTTRSYSIKYPEYNFIFNPEFLTARTANQDFLNQKQIILGGHYFTNIEQLYLEEFPNIPVKKVSWEEAELLKYTANVFYATKVGFSNQIYEICNKLGISYNTIKNLFIDNGWVSPMHLDVPGPDGKLGFGGTCFPKDIQAFISCGEWLGFDMDMFKSVNSFNRKIRGE